MHRRPGVHTHTRKHAHAVSQPHQLLGLSDSCSWREGAEVGGAKRQWQPFKLERQTETERERETDTQTHRQTDRNRERGRERARYHGL